MPDKTAYANKLAASFLFAGTGEETVRRALLSPECEICDFTGGSVIYSPENYRRSLGFLASGRAQVSKTTPDGSRIIMSVLMPGMYFGAMAIFRAEDERYVTTITAIGRCRVLFFGQGLMRELFSENFAMVENYIAYLSERVLFLNRKIDALASAGALGKLSAYLLEGISREPGNRIALPYGMSSLAEALGIGRASLYRAMDSLCEKGIVRRKGKNIEVLDIDALGSFTGESGNH